MNKTGTHKLADGSLFAISQCEDLGESGWAIKCEDFCRSKTFTTEKGAFNVFILSEDEFESLQRISPDEYHQSKLQIMAEERVLSDVPPTGRWSDEENHQWNGIDKLVGMVLKCLKEKGEA